MENLFKKIIFNYRFSFKRHVLDKHEVLRTALNSVVLIMSAREQKRGTELISILGGLGNTPYNHRPKYMGERIRTPFCR